jgi:hypothetical protein
MKKCPLFQPVEQTGKFPKSAEMNDPKTGVFSLLTISSIDPPLFSARKRPFLTEDFFPVRKWCTIPLSGIPGISNFRGYYNNGRGGTT